MSSTLIERIDSGLKILIFDYIEIDIILYL